MKKLFMLIFLFTECNSQPKIVPVKLEAEELEVIKDTFPSAICCYWQQMEHQNFKMIDNESKENEYKRFGKMG